jgi:alkylation response protein AidB-like acyl-CoA dehydrogenase
MRVHALRVISEDEGNAALVSKLYWSTWHQKLGELAMDVLGMDGQIVGERLSMLQRLFLFSRADTIYAGTSEIQKNIIAERGLGLPR